MRGFEFGFRVRGGFVPPLQGDRELIRDVYPGLRSTLHPRLSHDGLSALTWALRADTGGVSWERQKAECRMHLSIAGCGARAPRAAKIARRRAPRSFWAGSLPLLSELWFLAVRFLQLGRPAWAETGPLALNSTVAHPLPSSPLVPYGERERERICWSESTESLSERELSNISL